MIRDRNIEWKKKRLFIPVTEFSGLGHSAFLGAGDVVLAELSTLGIGAARLEDLTDKILHAMNLPHDVDVTQPIYARVHWTSDSAAAEDTATMKVQYKAIADQEALAAPDTALDTVIAADTLGGQLYLCKSPWGTINANKIAKDDLVVFEVSCSATDATIASEYIYVLGLELEYSPAKTAGNGMGREGVAN
jgi:hypothetical protein